MSAKQKIVVLIDWYLPGTKAGGPVRSIYSLVNLLKDDFEFFILTSNKDLGSEKEYSSIKPNVLFNKNGVNYCYFNSEGLIEKNILETIEKINPALIYINSFWSYPFSISIIRAKKKNKINMPLLLAPRGMLSPGALSLKAFKKKSYLFLSKISGWYNRITFQASNEQEKEEIRKQFPRAEIKIAPNVNAAQPLSKHRSKQIRELKLFYLSRIARVKNLDFALNIFREIPDISITYDIFGNIEDAEYWETCKEIIKTLPENIKVNYKGELDFDKIQETVSDYHALFLPTLNENFGHSIVESLSSGCLVLISDQTPWNDLSKYHAGFALALEDKTVFIEALRELASLSEKEFEKRSENAITYISGKINLQQIKQQYISLFNESFKN